MNPHVSLSLLLFAGVCARSEVAFDKAFLQQHLAPYEGRGFEWENSRIGISDHVPAPWLPVKVEGRTVTVTHRSLQLGERNTFYMPLFGYREFSKRFYVAATQFKPESLIIQHAVIPIGISSAYAVGSGGEHLKKYFSPDGSAHTHVIAADGTTRLAMDGAAYDPDYFRIPPMLYPVGNWFPVFGQNLSFSDILKGTADYYRDHPDRLTYYCRTFLARSLVHGVPIWIRSLDMPETLKVFKALDRYVFIGLPNWTTTPQAARRASACIAARCATIIRGTRSSTGAGC